MPVVISDTSPVRALAHLGLVDLLDALFGEVLIPPAVVDELEHPRERFTPVLIGGFRFIRVVAPANAQRVAEIRRSLDRGEAEALALAEELRADQVLMDETIGRAYAMSLGLNVLGLLGILLRAKSRGIIGAVGPLMDQLTQEISFFISPALRAFVLRQAGEQ